MKPIFLSYDAYDAYISENHGDSKEVQLNMLLSDIARNYNIKKVFMTDNVPFEVTKDVREWPQDLRTQVKIGEKKEIPTRFTIEYRLDSVPCKIAVNFTMIIKGQEETDSPEPGTYNGDNINPLVVGHLSTPVSIKLVDVQVERIQVESPDLDATVSKFSENTLRNVLNIMIKVLQPEYDVLGEKLKMIAMQQN